MRFKYILGAISLSLAFHAIGDASADVLLNNWTGPCNPNGSCTGSEINPQQGTFVENLGEGQFYSHAVGFSSGTANTLTDFTVYMYNGNGNFAGGNIDIGLMADSGGAPSGTFLDSVTLTTPESPPNNNTPDPVTVSGLSWALTPGTQYWLAAIAESGGYYVWNVSPSTSSGAYRVGDNSNAWNPGGGVPAALIEGDFEEALVPEPASMALLGSGLVALRFLRRRKLA